MSDVCRHGKTLNETCAVCIPDDSALTIRQQAVLMAMQGILAHPNAWNGNAEATARHAIETADAVLKAERDSR